MFYKFDILLWVPNTIICIWLWVCLPYYTLAPVTFCCCCCWIASYSLFFSSMWCLSCVVVVWYGVTYIVHAYVCVCALYLCFYLLTEWKLWGTSLGWFWVRACTSTCTWRDVQNDITLTHRHTKEKTLPALSTLYYFCFSVKSKAKSIEKKIDTHTHKRKNSQVHHHSSRVLVLPLSLLGTIILSSFFYLHILRCFFSPLTLLMNFCCCARVYVLLLLEPNPCTKYTSIRIECISHIEQFFDSSDMGYCITRSRKGL